MKPKTQERKTYIRTGRQSNSIRFATLSLPCLNYFYDLFYNKKNIKNIKQVPLNIYELLTARGLAF
jgi:hypothetical protein